MNVKQLIEQKLTEYLKSIDSNQEVVLEVPKDTTHGNLTTNLALKISKSLGKSPRDSANDIIKSLGEINGVSKIEIAGPGFLNFYINSNISKAIVNSILANSNYGETKTINEKWLIEHTSPNPNKAMHLGHLRNTVTGMAISNIAKAAGARVEMDLIDNNRGIAIAKLMWGFLKFANKDENKKIEDINYWYENQSEWKELLRLLENS